MPLFFATGVIVIEVAYWISKATCIHNIINRLIISLIMNVEQCWYLVHYNFEAELNVRELGYNECSCNLSRAPIMSVGSQAL